MARSLSRSEARELQARSVASRARNARRRDAARDLARSEALIVEIEELTAAQRALVEALIRAADSGQRTGGPESVGSIMAKAASR